MSISFLESIQSSAGKFPARTDPEEVPSARPAARVRNPCLPVLPIRPASVEALEQLGLESGDECGFQDIHVSLSRSALNRSNREC
jgi:hypothetical protein